MTGDQEDLDPHYANVNIPDISDFIKSLIRFVLFMLFRVEISHLEHNHVSYLKTLHFTKIFFLLHEDEVITLRIQLLTTNR